MTFWVEGPFDLISKTGLSRCLLTCPHVAIAKSPAMTKSTVVLGSGGGSPSLEFLERPPAPEATTLWAWNSPVTIFLSCLLTLILDKDEECSCLDDSPRETGHLQGFLSTLLLGSCEKPAALTLLARQWVAPAWYVCLGLDLNPEGWESTPNGQDLSLPDP